MVRVRMLIVIRARRREEGREKVQERMMDV